MTAIDAIQSSGDSSNGDEDVSEEEISNEGSTAESDNEEDVSSNDESPEPTNAAWADAISRILTSKPKGKKIVLSKAKKITDLKKVQTKSAGFEILTEEGDVKEEKIETPETKSSDEPAQKKKKLLPNLRVKPNILEKDHERILQKIATKGVVQLFNAVRNQQKDISKQLEEAGPLEVRKEKVLKNIDKRAFLDVLMGEKSQRVEDQMQDDTRKDLKSAEKESTWSVLQEDFMMGAKMKDWDKELEAEDEPEMEIESD